MAWDWLKAIPMWDWHKLALIGWPGWDREPRADEPLRVDMSFVSGEGLSSHAVASKFDDIATAAFYWRDFTGSGIPFVDTGDAYRSSFWFSRRADFETFRSHNGISSQEPGEE